MVASSGGKPTPMISRNRPTIFVNVADEIIIFGLGGIHRDPE